MAESTADFILELKQLFLESLDLEDITADEINPDEPLFGDGLGLDSIDALELGVAIQKKYGIKFKQGSEDNNKHFANLTTLADFIQKNRTL